MAVLNVRIESSLFQRAVESSYIVGELNTEIAHCLDNNKNPGSELLSRLQDERDHLRDLVDISSRIDRAAGDNFRLQATWIQTKIQFCLERVITHFVKQINQDFEATLIHLNSFRETHSKSAHEKAKEAFERFAANFKLYQSMSKGCELDEAQKRFLSGAENAFTFFTMQLEPTVSVQLLYNAHFAEEEANEKEKWVAMMQPQLDDLPKEHQDLIDTRIFVLGKGPNDAPHWGKEHRFDDMHRFRVALYEATHAICIERLKECAGFITEPELGKFYKTLHAVVKGPKTDAAEEWGKRELPYFQDFFGAAVNRLSREQQTPQGSPSPKPTRAQEFLKLSPSPSQSRRRSWPCGTSSIS